MRIGLLAEKVGMTRIFDQDGDHIPITVLKVETCKVVAQKTKDRDGYSAVQIGYGSAKPSRITKPLKNHYAKAGVEPAKRLAEFRVADDGFIDVGTELSVNHFIEGQFVDISATTQGKGFAGVMKRHNFAGLEATHGVSVSHRSHGSTGQCQDPGRVFKGKKMAGQMGNKKSTIQNLPIISVDEEKGLIMVRGSIPGSKGSMVRITDAVKKGRHPEAPYPTFVKEIKEETGVSEENNEAQGGDEAQANPEA